MASEEYSSKQIADLRLVLFGSALYGVTKVFKPFPEEFYDSRTDIHDIERLKACFRRIVLTDDLQDDQEARELLQYILQKNSYNFKKISLRALRSDPESKLLVELLEKNLGNPRTVPPKYIFKIHPSTASFRQRQFDDLKREHGTFFAFHGTKMQNIRSILEFGLVNVFSERQLYGPGIYMTTDIQETFIFSPFCENFHRGSTFDKRISAILACEVIDHPSIRDKLKNIPVNYRIVQNTDLIRVDSLMIYSNDTSTATPGTSSVSSNSRYTQWLHLYRHLDRGTYFFIGAVLVIVCLGFLTTSSPRDKKRFL